MSIRFDSETRVFALETAHTSYHMKVDALGHLLHLYYGKKIGTGDLMQLYPRTDRGFSPDYYAYRTHRGISPDLLPQEYTGCNVGDFRISCLTVADEKGAFGADFTYVDHTIESGKYSLTGLPCAHAEENDAETLIVRMQDETTGLTLELLYGVFAQQDVITRAARLTNHGDTPLRLDKFLTVRMEHCSRNRIQAAADSGNILVNGKAAKSSYKVKPLDRIQIVMPYPRREVELVAEDIPLDIPYEDQWLLLVDKPAGLVVHPGVGNYSGTLVNALAWHMKDIPDYDANDPHVGLVHRIDKDTSGLLVIAKTPDAKTNLGIQFFNKTTKRKYRALVWGVMEQDEGTIVGNIARNPRDRMQMAVMSDPTVGKHAVTHYRVLERLGYVTLVECILETGRTHQIRVHMKHIGHVLFNDERYGGHEILKGTHFSKYKQFVNNCFDTCPRQALHAMTLGFVHPVTGEEMYFTSELPDDMTRLIEKWRGYISNRELE